MFRLVLLLTAVLISFSALAQETPAFTTKLKKSKMVISLAKDEEKILVIVGRSKDPFSVVNSTETKDLYLVKRQLEYSAMSGDPSPDEARYRKDKVEIQMNGVAYIKIRYWDSKKQKNAEEVIFGNDPQNAASTLAAFLYS